MTSTPSLSSLARLNVLYTLSDQFEMRTAGCACPPSSHFVALPQVPFSGMEVDPDLPGRIFASMLAESFPELPLRKNPAELGENLGVAAHFKRTAPRSPHRRAQLFLAAPFFLDGGGVQSGSAFSVTLETLQSCLTQKEKSLLQATVHEMMRVGGVPSSLAK